MEITAGTLEANTQTLDVSDLSSGVYFIQVNNTPSTEKIKLVVQK